MVNGIQSDGKNSGAEEFMPFSCTELSKELVDYARMYLNETEETKKKAIEEVRKFIRREYKLQAEISDLLCLCFLRSRKFDVKRACSMFKKMTDFIEAHKSIFDRIDSDDAVRRTIQSRAIGFLPYRDSKGRAIFVLRAECWDPSKLSVDDIIFGSIVSLYSIGENPVNQVAGIVVIADYKNFTVQHFVALSRWMIFVIQALQNCCPYMVKEFHFVHASVLTKTMWNIAKHLVSQKFRNRAHFYKSTHWDSLHRKINPRILPEEFGGQLESYIYEHWAGDIEEIQKKYHWRLNELLKGCSNPKEVQLETK